MPENGARQPDRNLDERVEYSKKANSNNKGKGREGAIGVGVLNSQPLFGSCPGSHGPPWEQAERRLGVQATIGGAGRFYGWPIVNGQQVLHALPKTVRKIQIQGNIEVS